jgi:hypothetical protein
MSDDEYFDDGHFDEDEEEEEEEEGEGTGTYADMMASYYGITSGRDSESGGEGMVSPSRLSTSSVDFASNSIDSQSDSLIPDSPLPPSSSRSRSKQVSNINSSLFDPDMYVKELLNTSVTPDLVVKRGKW